MTKKEYAKVMFIGFYKKPVYFLSTLLGLYFMTTVVLNYLNVIQYYSETPLFEICCGLFFLLAPTLIIIIAVRQFASNPSFQNDLHYTFSDQGITVTGLTIKSEFVWAHIIKQRELDKFLILYPSKRVGYYIDKTKLTSEQLQFVKSKVG